MTTVREIMHTGATCVDEHETLTAAAQKMRDQGIGALPICGDDERLKGMLTDRDIVVRARRRARSQHDHRRRAGPGLYLPRRRRRQCRGDAQRHGRAPGPTAGRDGR